MNSGHRCRFTVPRLTVLFTSLACSAAGTGSVGVCKDGEARTCGPGQVCSGQEICTGGARPSRTLQDPPTDPGALMFPDLPLALEASCEEAASASSYIGCEYWPTPLANLVAPIFDFAVVVANVNSIVADVTVTRPGFSRSARVPPGELVKIYLPWVDDLRGPGTPITGPERRTAELLTHSLRAVQGAYHLQSSVPVVAYQFNALEYKPEGGGPDKDWQNCTAAIECYSYSNDASLLLPTSALTANYRLTAHHVGYENTRPGSYFGITAVEDQTQVELVLPERADLIPEDGAAPGAWDPSSGAPLLLDRGDVMQILGWEDKSRDLSGTLIRATRPVQVITGTECANNPRGVDACDHLEESALPVEAWGRHYVVTRPTGPNATPVGHTVRLLGNVDGTQLRVDPPLAGAPSQLDAGQVVDLGVVGVDFEIESDHEISISTFQLGGALVDWDVPDARLSRGDPSQSVSIPVEQYREHYVFLAPDDYDANFVDIVLPAGTSVRVDGLELGSAGTAVGNGEYGVLRAKLGSGRAGAHVLEASAPVGLQVTGYGAYTSYQYPGGLNLERIAPPPIR